MLDLLAILANVFFFFLYIQTAGSFPKPLSAEEERRLLAELQNGSLEARNTLTERNMRLVAHIIKKHYAGARDQDDLLSIGCIGLIKAIDSFDVNKGARLATYAARCIENEILMYFRNQKKSAGDISLHEIIDTDSNGNELTLTDILSMDDTILENIELKGCVEQLYRSMEKVLKPRELEIVALRYGLCNQKAFTQREVAARLGISRSYVSRIEKKALEKLRSELEKSRSE